MALTRRLQILDLLRKADKGSVPITVPTQVQTEWNALLAKYQAQTTALKDNWNLQVKQAIATDQKTIYASQFSALPQHIITKLGVAADAAVLAEETI